MRVHLGTADKLAAMLAETPNLCAVKTLEAIGAELGVTRQRVQQLLPRAGIDRRRARHARRLAAQSRILAQYVESHPLALLARSMGGPPMKEISRETGIRGEQLLEVWRLCGYPPKQATALSLIMSPAEQARRRWATNEDYRRGQAAAQKRWTAANPEKAREIIRRAQAKYYAKKKAERMTLHPSYGGER